ncbi:MAG TPA: hypothetical protein VFQ35_05910 [Polyangiaceae bacterium]|nr:hypothetical protein [Polyangiaceae bacterium]
MNERFGGGGQDIERQRGYAREVHREQALAPTTRARPKMGGQSPLPSVVTAAENYPNGGRVTPVDLFSLQLPDLEIWERAQPGWVIRLTSPARPPGYILDIWTLQPLFLELGVISGGFEQRMIVDVAPAFSLQVACERIWGRLGWSSTEVKPPPGALLDWQVTRGICETTARRAFLLSSIEGSHEVPGFAGSFSLITGNQYPSNLRNLSGGLALSLVFAGDDGELIQTFDRDQILGLLNDGQRVPLPPFARTCGWTGSNIPLRIVYHFGGNR